MEHYANGTHVWPVAMGIDMGDLSDGLHPNDYGYSMMAQSWYYAIRQVNSFGWIIPPVAGTATPVLCDHNITWISQGQSTDGAGLGTNGDETECQN